MLACPLVVHVHVLLRKSLYRDISVYVMEREKHFKTNAASHKILSIQIEYEFLVLYSKSHDIRAFKGNAYSWCILYTGDNFCDFLFVIQYTNRPFLNTTSHNKHHSKPLGLLRRVRSSLVPIGWQKVVVYVYRTV